jgi:hypothetical protein
MTSGLTVRVYPDKPEPYLLELRHGLTDCESHDPDFDFAKLK